MLLLTAVKSGDFLSVCVCMSAHMCMVVRVLLFVHVCDLVQSVTIMGWVYGPAVERFIGCCKKLFI